MDKVLETAMKQIHEWVRTDDEKRCAVTIVWDKSTDSNGDLITVVDGKGGNLVSMLDGALFNGGDERNPLPGLVKLIPIKRLLKGKGTVVKKAENQENLS